MASKTNYVMNGKDYFRISASFGKDSSGKLIRKYFYGRNEKDAKKKVEEYKESLKYGLVIDKNAYLGSVMNTWLFEVVSISNKIKPTTFERYEGIYRLYIKTSFISTLPLKDIKSIDIQKYYNALSKNGKSVSIIHNLNKLLKQFMSYAENEGYLIKNPCNRLVIPGKVEELKEEVEIFTNEELKTIVNCKEDSLINDMAIICLATGLRRGECLGLKWDDIDYKENEINIRRTVSTVTIIENDTREKKQIIQIPKTKGSVRSVPFTSTLKTTIKKLEKRQNKNKLKVGESYNKDYDGFIFLTENGNLINASNLSNSWDRFLIRVQIPHKKFHALRHTYATMQFEAGLPLKTVSVLLGHSSIDITANTYTHVLKKEKEKSIDILSVLKMC